MINSIELGQLYELILKIRKGVYGNDLQSIDSQLEQIQNALDPNGSGTRHKVSSATSSRDRYPALENRTVLVIDDDENMHRFFRLALPDTCRLDSASDGRQALAYLETGKPDLIVLDIVMPGMDGAGFLEAFSRLDHLGNVPVIILSSLSRPELQLSMIREGAVAYLVKPVEEQTVLERMHSLLSLQQKTKQIMSTELKRRIDSVFASDIEPERNVSFKTRLYAELGFSFREQSITEEILAGKSNKQIAIDLNISANTVNTHVQNIYKKARVKSRVELYKLFNTV